MSGQTEREVLLSLKNVEISFDVGGKHKFKAVQDASFDIYRGETFALVGESGSGKTTIGRAIMRINPLSAGEILFEGKRISGKLSKQEDMNVIRSIQMIFQDPAASLNERATIEYCISEGLYNFHLYKNEEERIAKVDRAVLRVAAYELCHDRKTPDAVVINEAVALAQRFDSPAAAKFVNGVLSTLLAARDQEENA